MKKLILIGATVGIASLAQATSSPITILATGSQIVGTESYVYQESITKGTQIASASIVFTSIELYTAGTPPNVLFCDLINNTSTGGAFANQPNGFSTPESGTDYFQTSSTYSGVSDQLTSKTFYAPGNGGIGKPYYDTETWTYNFTGQALTDLENDVLNRGYFDIGLDPNCYYDINGSIVLNYTVTTGGNGKPVPDHAMTVCLLGMSFLGMMVFRRKLALN